MNKYFMTKKNVKKFMIKINMNEIIMAKLK